MTSLYSWIDELNLNNFIILEAISLDNVIMFSAI